MCVIGSFRDSWLELFFRHDESGKRIPADIEDRLFRKLQLLDDAVSEKDLRSPPGNKLEKLSGNLAGYYSIRVNAQWRLLFMFDGNTGEACDVYLDPHKYKG